MAKFQHYITGEDTDYGLSGVYWRAETFTVSITHQITQVKLRLMKEGTVGTITVGIKAVDGNGHPTGADLTSGTYDGDTLTSSLAWVTISMDADYQLMAGTKYAIVVRIAAGDINNEIRYGVDESSPTYTGGCLEASGDSGVNWTTHTGIDWMFEEWGDKGIFLPDTTTDPLRRVSGIVRSFWAGIGGQAVYQCELALGGMGTTYISPIGEREPASATEPSKLPSGQGYQYSDYQAWLNSGALLRDIVNFFGGKVPSYEEWVRWKQTPYFPKYF